MNKEWEYYNHALIPTLAPHEEPDTSWMKDRKMWRQLADGKYPLFARWTTEFDCDKETGWWYCIKDNPFDLACVKAKYRWTINHGLKSVDIKIIQPSEYADEMVDVHEAACLGYGSQMDEDEIKDLKKSFDSFDADNIDVIGAFLKENGKMIGYGIYEVYNDWVSQSVIKTDPAYLKTDVNAAMVYFAVMRYLNPDTKIKYISNGAKNILHDTNFHEYLIKYFGFRKANCKLHMHCVPIIKIAVNIIYPFRKVIYKAKTNHVLKKIISILQMEEISREGTV